MNKGQHLVFGLYELCFVGTEQTQNRQEVRTKEVRIRRSDLVIQIFTFADTVMNVIPTLGFQWLLFFLFLSSIMAPKPTPSCLQLTTWTQIESSEGTFYSQMTQRLSCLTTITRGTEEYRTTC